MLLSHFRREQPNKSAFPLSEVAENVLAGMPLRYAKERSAFSQRDLHAHENTDAHMCMCTHIPKRYNFFNRKQIPCTF